MIGHTALFTVYIFTSGHDFDVGVPLLTLGTGHGYSGGYSCLDALDRELGEISQEIENDGSSVMAQIFQDFESQVLPRTTGIADHKHSPASKSFIEPSRQGEASAHGNVHHVRDPSHARTEDRSF